MVPTSIRDLYGQAPQEEWERLARDAYHALELRTTLRFLEKYLPPSGSLLDAGGGPGRYTIALARRGYKLSLLDFTPELLEIARQRIREAGADENVMSIQQGSITVLGCYDDEAFDGVLCLGGPLSHLRLGEQRLDALRELARVAKPGAPVFVSVMGRLAILAELPHYWPEEVLDPENYRRLWQDGDDVHFRGDAYCHFFLPEELEALVSKAGLDVVERVGLEGLGSHFWDAVNSLSEVDEAAWRGWLASHEHYCTHPAVYATSSHMLIVAKKPLP